MSGTAEYRVLARKYRPTTFGELIGHDTLVRTLTNAFNSGRIAHAFMLTGVRGVGKTTTARLIARALNCIGPDGTGGPTMSPCGLCDPCRAIAEDRHPDVIEMDAASRTGVDDMRELIESVRYRPVSARYKIYIVDEVHMLSKAAFNALLKTLEEPPPDIKFVFATTEINKVPVTVLSRCQRYTLPRIGEAMLAEYYGTLAVREAVSIEPAALALIARAADGSVRDGLSILDQAIALGFGQTITETAVRDMLGVADRGLTFDLFEALLGGDAARALGLLEALYNGGTDPAMVMQDLLDLTHFVTRLKLERPNDPAAAVAPLADGQDRQRGAALAGKLGIAVLARCWQMLLKGLGEVQTAPQPMKAAEMALIRLVFVTDLPPPGEIVKALQNGAAARPAPNGGAGPGGSGPR
ncbi:MAG: DNA polymerase III subunit gamma/tau, partial [Aliidongia sp.]